LVPEWSLGVAFFLLFNIIAGLWRVLRGPTPTDSMLAAQLFGTTGVAILLLLAPTLGSALRDVALVFALLAAVATVAFVQHPWRQVGTKYDEVSLHE
jgi:multicomponent Na+:H+ antiporter subunit F